MAGGRKIQPPGAENSRSGEDGSRSSAILSEGTEEVLLPLWPPSHTFLYLRTQHFLTCHFHLAILKTHVWKSTVHIELGFNIF